MSNITKRDIKEYINRLILYRSNRDIDINRIRPKSRLFKKVLNLLD